MENSSNYKFKYLKYKNKYLNLKDHSTKQKGGYKSLELINKMLLDTPELLTAPVLDSEIETFLEKEEFQEIFNLDFEEFEVVPDRYNATHNLGNDPALIQYGLTLHPPIISDGGIIHKIGNYVPTDILINEVINGIITWFIVTPLYKYPLLYFINNNKINTNFRFVNDEIKNYEDMFDKPFKYPKYTSAYKLKPITDKSFNESDLIYYILYYLHMGIDMKNSLFLQFLFSITTYLDNNRKLKDYINSEYLPHQSQIHNALINLMNMSNSGDKNLRMDIANSIPNIKKIISENPGFLDVDINEAIKWLLFYLINEYDMTKMAAYINNYYDLITIIKTKARTNEYLLNLSYTFTRFKIITEKIKKNHVMLTEHRKFYKFQKMFDQIQKLLYIECIKYQPELHELIKTELPKVVPKDMV